jgi:hypothetical protein
LNSQNQGVDAWLRGFLDVRDLSYSSTSGLLVIFKLFSHHHKVTAHGIHDKQEIRFLDPGPDVGEIEGVKSSIQSRLMALALVRR